MNDGAELKSLSDIYELDEELFSQENSSVMQFPDISGMEEEGLDIPLPDLVAKL